MKHTLKQQRAQIALKMFDGDGNIYIDFDKSFFELSWIQIEEIEKLSRAVGYRKHSREKSRAREFYDYIREGIKSLPF